ncbi:MAG: AraC family transcriptional regulator [Ferruginibacter sp.]
MHFDKSYNLVKIFPDFFQKDFDMELYNRQFKSANVIIQAKAKKVNYPAHWGPLSIKCAFKGKEFYELNNCMYAVNDQNYLVINEGSRYSSFIDSHSEVNSFTLNFSPLFVKESMESMVEPDEKLLADYSNFSNRNHIDIVERLYTHDCTVSPLVFKILALTEDFEKNINQVEELYFSLFEQLIFKQKSNLTEIRNVQAIKHSTQMELYKRLHRAKDFIDSCYTEDISLDDLAKMCWLNKSYFLRQFKKYFAITPGQYIILKRMQEAKQLLERKSKVSIVEICHQVGYSDLSSFSRLFKNYYRHSPEKYRNNNAPPQSK